MSPRQRKAGDFLLCEYHRDRLFGWSHKRTLWGIGEIRDAQIAADRERIREEEAELAKRCIVYYLQRESDGLIKIGSTTSPRSRFSKLKSDYGPLRLLATRGGMLRHEREIQDKFDALLAETREWFRPDPRLLRHILRLRKQYEVRDRTGLPVAETAEIRAMIRAFAYSPTALAVSSVASPAVPGHVLLLQNRRSDTAFCARPYRAVPGWYSASVRALCVLPGNPSKKGIRGSAVPRAAADAIDTAIEGLLALRTAPEG